VTDRPTRIRLRHLGRLAQVTMVLGGTAAWMTVFGWILRGDLIDGRAPWGWMILAGMFLGMVAGLLWLIDLGVHNPRTPPMARSISGLFVLLAESPILFFFVGMLFLFQLSNN
jgi:hypothetical protein